MGLYFLDRLRNRGASYEQSLLFVPFQALHYIESSKKSDTFYPKISIFLHACATCIELPSNTSTMILGLETFESWKIHNYCFL